MGKFSMLMESTELVESLRKIAQHTSADGTRHSTVHRDAEWQEYRVKHHENGKHLPDADYHTDDKQEAIEHSKNYANGTSA